MAFSEKIYKVLESFVKEPSMAYFLEKDNVRRYYARHNLFALFERRDILLKLKNKEEFLCSVQSYKRDEMTIKYKKETKSVSWYEIDNIEEKNCGRKRQ